MLDPRIGCTQTARGLSGDKIRDRHLIVRSGVGGTTDLVSAVGWWLWYCVVLQSSVYSRSPKIHPPLFAHTPGKCRIDEHGVAGISLWRRRQPCLFSLCEKSQSVLFETRAGVTVHVCTGTRTSHVSLHHNTIAPPIAPPIAPETLTNIARQPHGSPQNSGHTTDPLV